jgi:hypothetical protein
MREEEGVRQGKVNEARREGVCGCADVARRWVGRRWVGTRWVESWSGKAESGCGLTWVRRSFLRGKREAPEIVCL